MNREERSFHAHRYQEQRSSLINWQEGHQTEGLSCRGRQKAGQWETCVRDCYWTLCPQLTQKSLSHTEPHLNRRKWSEGGSEYLCLYRLALEFKFTLSNISGLSNLYGSFLLTPLWLIPQGHWFWWNEVLTSRHPCRLQKLEQTLLYMNQRPCFAERTVILSSASSRNRQLQTHNTPGGKQ